VASFIARGRRRRSSSTPLDPVAELLPTQVDPSGLGTFGPPEDTAFADAELTELPAVVGEDLEYDVAVSDFALRLSDGHNMICHRVNLDL
jgi:hypothetical protein